MIVRLCEVAPDGSSTLVTRALQNLTHRDSDEFPEPLEPGKRYRVKVRLDACGHAFAAGNRIRVGVSPTYWPWAWPSPEAATLTIYAGASRLSLPIRPPRAGRRATSPHSASRRNPRRWPPSCSARARPAVTSPVTSPPAASGSCTTGMWAGVTRLPNGLEYGDTNHTTFEIVEGDPLSAEVRCRMTGSQARGDWRIRWESDSVMTCDADDVSGDHHAARL